MKGMDQAYDQFKRIYERNEISLKLAYLEGAGLCAFCMAFFKCNESYLTENVARSGLDKLHQALISNNLYRSYYQLTGKVARIDTRLASLDTSQPTKS
jgi:hypothetical protein